VDGETLSRIFVQRPRWDVHSTVALGTQLCAALRGLHRLGLANRDVSPNNLMLTKDNHLKMIDFGLVKDAQGLLELMEDEDILAGRDFAEDLDSGLLLGTLDYVAPEQLADSSLTTAAMTQTDTWSDVYSVGLILWQMLTGKPLFTLDMSGEPDVVARRVLEYVAERTSFDEDLLWKPPEIPDPLFQILIRSLRLDPRRRQRDAMVLGYELARYLETGQTEEHDDERTEYVQLGSFLSALGQAQAAVDGEDRDDEDDEEPTRVRTTGSMSSIPVVLDFADETGTVDVQIPRQDPPPRGDPDLDPWADDFEDDT
jgi:serine/threonine-protein kinase